MTLPSNAIKFGRHRSLRGAPATKQSPTDKDCFAALLMNKSVVRTAHATSLFLRGSISAQRYGVLAMTPQVPLPLTDTERDEA
jgi:hypothetical protein